jgi:hypothetical protein
MGLIGGLKKKVKGAMLGTITGIILKRAGSGELGPFAKKLYWGFVGRKTQISAVLAAPPLIMEALVRSGLCAAFEMPCDLWSTKLTAVMLSVSGAFLYLGQVDGALRITPPEIPYSAPKAAVKAVMAAQAVDVALVKTAAEDADARRAAEKLEDRK